MPLNRRQLFSGLAASLAIASIAKPSAVFAQSAPSAGQIQRSLEAAPKRRLRKGERILRRDLRRRRDIRRIAPSIDIQAINFEFGSARIPFDQYWKVENIAIAMRRMLRSNPGEVFLIEGHTDAVGSRRNNQILSEKRAISLGTVLMREFGVDPRAIEIEGFGEDQLLVPTPYAEWRNRRVTLRRITDVIIR